MTEEQLLALACIEHVDWLTVDFEQDNGGLSQSHIKMMLVQILEEEVSGNKAHRFIGWVQAVMCMEGLLTLDDARNMNRKVIEEVK